MTSHGRGPTQVTVLQATSTTDQDIVDYAHGIPNKLVPCVTNRHEWTHHNVVAFDRRDKAIAAGDETRVRRNAVRLSVTERCSRCHMLRHQDMFPATGDFGQWTYSQRNAALISPAGIRQTGKRPRRVLRMEQKFALAASSAAPLKLRRPAAPLKRSA